jgi:arylsulfatase A-like enzyme
VDVYPTLADACGLPPATGLAGTSLVPLLRDPTGSVKAVAVSQYPRAKADGADTAVMGYSIRDDRWRFTAWREDGGSRIVAQELYDERDDPHETRNLASDPQFKPVIDRLSAHLPPPGPASPKATKSGGKKKARPAAL